MSKQEDIINDLPSVTQEAIKRYPRFPERRIGFIDGYQYAVEKACEWLQCLEHELGYMCTGDFINSFRKAMEE